MLPKNSAKSTVKETGINRLRGIIADLEKESGEVILNKSKPPVINTPPAIDFPPEVPNDAEPLPMPKKEVKSIQDLKDMADDVDSVELTETKLELEKPKAGPAKTSSVELEPMKPKPTPSVKSMGDDVVSKVAKESAGEAVEETAEKAGKSGLFGKALGYAKANKGKVAMGALGTGLLLKALLGGVGTLADSTDTGPSLEDAKLEEGMLDDADKAGIAIGQRAKGMSQQEIDDLVYELSKRTSK